MPHLSDLCHVHHFKMSSIHLRAGRPGLPDDVHPRQFQTVMSLTVDHLASCQYAHTVGASSFELYPPLFLFVVQHQAVCDVPERQQSSTRPPVSVQITPLDGNDCAQSTGWLLLALDAGNLAVLTIQSCPTMKNPRHAPDVCTALSLVSQWQGTFRIVTYFTLNFRLKSLFRLWSCACVTRSFDAVLPLVVFLLNKIHFISGNNCT